MSALCDIAYAKINLALHVRKRRDDGYHALETLFAFVDQGDRLFVSPSSALSLEITGPFAEELSNGPDNLVLRAAKLLAEINGISAGAAFRLEKRLPIASGIGGGSADAAAALRLVSQLWNIGENDGCLSAVAAQLGADVPACVASQTCFGSGVGEKLTSVAIEGLVGTPILLLNPMVACPTGAVFKMWDGIDRGPLDVACWSMGRNDLQAPAIALHPIIADVLEALHSTAPTFVRMSGSGATCFALYQSDEQLLAAEQAIAAYGWWHMIGRLR
jgi:4-diphosphocytidyl-2-C-methyl-D-erythritol kinase